MNQSKLIELAKDGGKRSDSDLSRRLDVPRQTIGRWKKEMEAIPDHHALTLAKLAGQDQVTTLAELKIEKADPRARWAYEELARRSKLAETLSVILNNDLFKEAIPENRYKSEF